MTSTLVPLFGPIPGGMEMVVILLIAVLLFGANKIPKLARSTGQAMGEFQRGREEIEQELEEVKQGGTTDSESTLEDTTTETTSTETTSTTDADTTDADTTDADSTDADSTDDQS